MLKRMCHTTAQMLAVALALGTTGLAGDALAWDGKTLNSNTCQAYYGRKEALERIHNAKETDLPTCFSH